MQYEPREQWIWLPEEKYPERQLSAYSPMSGKSPDEGIFTVAECRRTYSYAKPVSSVKLRFSGDSAVKLWLGDKFAASGPAGVGGDFLGNDKARPQYYAYELELCDYPGMAEGRLSFYAMIRMNPVQICDYSMGHGGFMLNASVRFADGTKTLLSTDESWDIRPIPAYTSANHYDGSQADVEWLKAERIFNRWHCLTAPIPPCTETNIIPDGEFTLRAGETIDQILPFDMIYAGRPEVSVCCSDRVELTLRFIETDEGGSAEEYVFHKDAVYRGFTLHSAGKLRVIARNPGSCEAHLRIGFVSSHYPVGVQAITETSDSELNMVLKVCAHTLRYCRQTIHLDSARHCEPLACTGDYYIEALMTAFTYGDMRLAAFDVRRTAQLLRYNDGRMFHTTYSLIWVQMLWDVYRFTGETGLLRDCEDALILLLERFGTYVGENRLIETPPDYMFIDWLYPDNISTHHPPKALGQTCLNLFYYGALRTAAEIFGVIGEPEMAAEQQKAADILHDAIKSQLYDAGRGLFFEGLNTPTPEELLYQYMPQNVSKLYYRRHANILAAYFGFFGAEENAGLIDRVMSDDSLGEIQPYFAHFLLEAVYRCGLREKYTLRILEDWKQPVRECPCGLAEGFVKPEPSYHFDHSHAWGGTPACSLPLALSGLEIIEPGFGKIRLSPSLLGLESATVRIPAPQGIIEIIQKRGEPPVVTLPEGIELLRGTV